MTTDARNSLNLWLGAATVLLVGAALVYSGSLDEVVDNVPSRWFWVAIAVLGAVNMGQFAWGMWQRRASNPGNLNRR